MSDFGGLSPSEDIFFEYCKAKRCISQKLKCIIANV